MIELAIVILIVAILVLAARATLLGTKLWKASRNPNDGAKYWYIELDQPKRIVHRTTWQSRDIDFERKRAGNVYLDSSDVPEA